jgi:phosphoenolpyruvate---glycerone phosphotransferase subunit DhaK
MREENRGDEMKKPKKILNDPRRATEEMMEGLVLAYDGRVGRVEGHGALYLKDMPKEKVALLVGGGSGHEPIFGGFIGRNLADGAACGEVFTSPSPQTICEAARAIHRGRGVVFVYGNYSGDNMNFDMAAEFLAAEGIETRTIRVRDDVAVGAPGSRDDRRGIAGDVFVIKIAGGASAELSSLDDVARVAAKAEANTRSMGVAVSPGSLPESGKPTFELGEDEIEIGMGAHGEKGVKRQKLSTADDITEQMMAAILRDLPYASGRRGGAPHQQSRRIDHVRTPDREPPRAADPGGGGHQGAPQLHRLLPHLAGDGGLLDFAHEARWGTQALSRPAERVVRVHESVKIPGINERVASSRRRPG